MKSRLVNLGVIMGGVALGHLTGAFAASPSTTTIYVDQYFEVRDHDTPVKYVFNGNTRVARVTGSLAATPRIQRLRLQRGWNLLSLAVSVTDAMRQVTNAHSASLNASSMFRWDTANPSWVPLLPGQNLSAEAILWLTAAADCSLALTGEYHEPTSRNVDAFGAFVAGAGLQGWDFASALSNVLSATAWAYDGSVSGWLAILPAPLQTQSDSWLTMAPGSALFVRAGSPGQLLLPDPASRIRYYHEDHLGSSSVLSDAAGAVVEEVSYVPFGARRNDFRLRAAREPYAFSQKEGDEESGLLYFEARYLAGTLSRFITSDRKYANPDALSSQRLGAFVSDPQAMNLFAYVRNNPVKFTDPTGEDPGNPVGSSGEVTLKLSKGTEVTVAQDDVFALGVRELRQHYLQSALYPEQELRRWDYCHEWDDPKKWADPSDLPYLNKRLQQENPGSTTYMFIHAEASTDPDTRYVVDASVHITIKSFYADQQALQNPWARLQAGAKASQMLDYLKAHPVPKLRPETTYDEYEQQLNSYRSQMFRAMEVMNGYQPAPANK